MTIWIYSGDRPSNSAKELASFPGFKRLRTGKFLKSKDFVVNWGTTNLDFKFVPDTPIINIAGAVKLASNKLHAFQTMSPEVQCVPWTIDQNEVKSWSEDGCTIVGRQKLTGHSGDGIIIIEKDQEIQPALLYTKYIFKTREFRVHVVNGVVVDTQMKIRDPAKQPLTWKVRSHANGFIFARNNVPENANRDALGVAACSALGLDFGAVDIVEDKHGSFYVLEVNTAPGLEGQTITSYRDAFLGLAAHD
jgi:glutathione synthase/RimK-type ligase-like ATP-grasp enzyme